MEFTILGPTRLHVHGVQVDLGTYKQRGLLALLLHDANNSVPIDTLIGELWSPDRTFEQVRSNFHALVSRLRKALESADAPARIVRDGYAYRISTDPALIDLHRFRAIAEQAYESAARHDHATACGLLKSGLALWTPMPLAEVRGPWADHCREQLETFDRLRAHYALFDSQLALGENTEVLRVVGDLVRGHELDEELVLRQMRALAALGRVTEAIRVYNRFRERVADELGTDPGPELRALHTRLLRSESDFTVHAQLTVHSRPTRQLPRPVPDFIGRADLLARLDTLAGTHRVFTLHGMPGVGKTSLAVQWIDRNRAQFPDGQYSIDLRGYGPTAPLAPEDALSLLLLSLGDAEIPKTVDERQARIRTMLAHKKVALLIDDAHDSGQVKPLLAATPDCVVLITSRDMLAGLAVHDHAVSLTVSPLDTAESFTLLTSSLGPNRAAEDRDAVRRLADLTGGLPLGLRIVTQRVVERPHTRLADLARELQRQDVLGILGTGDEGATLAVPFSWSFAALSPAAAGTFAALGLLPSVDFSAEAVCALLDADRSEVVQSLRALVRVSLVQHGTGRRFRLHDMLHGYAAQLAEHTDAVPDREAAQRRLLDWYVLSMAAGYRRVVPVGAEIPPLPDPSPVRPMAFADESEAVSWVAQEAGAIVQAVELSWRLGLYAHTWTLVANAQEIFDSLSLHREIAALLRTGLAAAKLLDNREAVCGLTNDYGMAAYRLGDNATARVRLTEALEIADREGFHELKAIVLANLASVVLAAAMAGDDRAAAREAVDLYHAALVLIRESGTPYTEAVALDQLARAQRKLGRDDLAFENYFTALAIQERIGHARGAGTTLSELAGLYHEHGENGEALLCARRALDLQERSGDREHIGVTVVTMAEILYDFGAFEESIATCVRALGMGDGELSEGLQVRALIILGYARSALGENGDARAAWSRAVEILVAADTPADDVRLAQLDRLLRTGVRTADLPGGPVPLWDASHGA
ncbi:BTAD domain-containing putative transcriptional regulator [Kutzneria sp. NPDC051319]|uniref:AfsR/SARP family transcriptional regulator n=1 Tax=Kutzneria sp. NPDC051319 TaxID=3155047 RepID=UPI00343C2D54